jgi:hypothetical protein
MLNILRLAVMALIVIAVGLAAALEQPEWQRDLGVTPYIETARAYQPPWQQSHHRVPGPKSQAIDQRHFAKACIIDELLDGRLTLFEAAALFRRLNTEYPVFPVLLARKDDPEEEQYCWQVIEYVSVTKAHKDASRSLMEELLRHKEQHGRVVLPDVPS